MPTHVFDLPNNFNLWLRQVSDELTAEDVEGFAASIEVILAGGDENDEAVSSATDVLHSAGAPCCPEELPR